MVAIPMIKSHASDVMYVSYSKKIYQLPYNTVLLGRGYIFCYERNTYCRAFAFSNGRNSSSQFSLQLQENVNGFRKTTVQTVWYDPEMAEEGNLQL